MSRRDKGKESPFGDVISSYGDREALEDGVLGDVSRLNLKTPKGHPISRITTSIQMLAMTQGADQWEARIRQMVAACTREKDGWFIADEFEGEGLWLIDNEVGGYTLMRPSDY